MFSPQAPQNRRKHWYHALRIGHGKLYALAVVALFLVLAAAAVLVVYTIRVAKYDMGLLTRNLPGSVLYDSENRMVACLTTHSNAPVQWDELPLHLIQAFQAREDEHFFSHHGVDYMALLRSALRNIGAMRYKQGAGTITMQLARHIFELRDKTPDRKLLEIMLAQRLEDHYDKATILCQYLSRIYFGRNCYGLREAARFYFGRQVRNLDLSESAMLAGIVRAPSLYNPIDNINHAVAARNETLQRMQSLGFISPAECKSTSSEPLHIAPPTEDTSTAPLSYPALWANTELDSLPFPAQERARGLSVGSSLNLAIQQYLEQAVQRTLRCVENPSAPYPTPWRKFEISTPSVVKSFAATKRPPSLRPGASIPKHGQGKLQCCALVADARLNRRGDILAIVCGRDTADGINRWLLPVRPGRTAAPLVFYSACLPGESEQHIVAHSAAVTGSRLGYETVRKALAAALPEDVILPSREKEQDLYNGLYSLRKIDLACLLFDLQNLGRDYTLHLISYVQSGGQRLLYAADPTKVPAEKLRREGAVAVSHLSPFLYREGEPLTLNEELPEGDGFWSMVFNDRGVAVFVWLGAETPEGSPYPATPELRRLMGHAAAALALELHGVSRKILRAAAERDRK